MNCALSRFFCFLFFFMATFGMKETHHEAKRENVTCLLLYASCAVPWVHQIYIYVYIHVFYKNSAYFLQGVSIVTMIVFCLRECVGLLLFSASFSFFVSRRFFSPRARLLVSFFSDASRGAGFSLRRRRRDFLLSFFLAPARR